MKVKKKEEDIISEDRFQLIKMKLEEDYYLSEAGWTDEELKKKIDRNLNDEIKNLFDTDEDDDEYEAISKIVEAIGEELLEII